METFFENISILAKKALIHEVLLSPKPGLVDRFNSGAHSDMDIYTFMDSVLSIKDYFYECTNEGYNHNNSNYFEILEKIRPIGIEAEKRMFLFTKEINTHKGAIFIFGILCSAIGSLKRENKEFNIINILKRSSQISDKILDDFKNIDLNKEKLSYGEKQFLESGSLGVRGEAKNGFPLLEKSYLEFETTINEGFNEEIAIGQSLLYLMNNLIDTNIIGRKGLSGIDYIKSKSEEIIDLGGYKTEEGILKINEVDKDFIRENISPGGCADLAAATLFLYWVINI